MRPSWTGGANCSSIALRACGTDSALGSGRTYRSSRPGISSVALYSLRPGRAGGPGSANRTGLASSSGRPRSSGRPSWTLDALDCHLCPIGIGRIGCRIVAGRSLNCDVG